MPTDIEIARSVTPLPITEVAKNAGVDVKHLIPYGFDKAKVDYSLLNEPTDHQAKLVLVTAINPTPAGEGKTTTTIGLADGLRRRGVKSAVALREPSLGPVFGVKGGAAGGGWAQVIPMEDINLHFTGDFHAIGAANNLLAAMLDNHIQQGNQLGIDVKRITWKRVVDMNDRQLRHVIDGIGGKAQGVPREDGFDITVASEVMAILCLSTSINDLKERLGEIVVGYSYAGEPVRARDLKAQGAMAALLKDALKPNLVQTLEGTPAFVHGGPFANIAHGCIPYFFKGMEETVAQPNAEDLQKVKEILLKQAAVSEKSNGYWLGALSTYERMGVDTHSDYKEMVKTLKASEISDFLKNVILKSGNHFEIIMKAVKNEK